MKYILLLSLTLFFSLEGLPAPKLKAKAAILINAKTGTVLYEKNADELLPPASTTKIATCAYILHLRGDKLDNLAEAKQDAIGWISEEKKIRSGYTIPAYWLEPGASHVSIKKGEKLTLQELLIAMMVASADDASNVLAQYIGGTIPTFMSDLNLYLREIGLEKTKFYNPHGLHHPKHLTSARELATLTQIAMKDPKFEELVGMTRYTLDASEFRNETTLIQTNRLLRKKRKEYYPRAIGVKTGFTSKAGYCLVAAAKEGDRTLIAVLLGCPSSLERFQEAKKLFEMAFRQKESRLRLFKKGKLPLKLTHPTLKKEIALQIKEEMVIAYFDDEKPKIKCQVAWTSNNEQLQKGEAVGEIIALNQETGSVLAKRELFALEDEKLSIWKRIRQMPLYGKALFVFGFLFLTFGALRKVR